MPKELESHPDPSTLRAFDGGRLGGRAAAEVEEHLAVCRECLARFEEPSGDDYIVDLVRKVAGAGRELPDASAPPEVPTGYDLIEPIGRGGMGVVFKARQRGLGRLVALKRIKAGLDADPGELSRFLREAEAAARLSHPNIVRVFDVGRLDGLPYIAMELVEGETLAERLRRGPLPPTEVAELARTLAEAIAHAHENGVVHRDLKPANILLGSDSSPRIVDFGLVKLDGGGDPTKTGAMVGTPLYMSPEQFGAGPVGPLIDVHAIGAILYECLTGRPPFRESTPIELAEAIRSRDPDDPGSIRAGIPRDLRTICLKCLEKSPDRRYRDAEALAEDLGRHLRSEPILARPTGPLGRLRKYVRRRPWQSALFGVLLLSCGAGAAGLYLHESRLRDEVRRTAEAAEEASRQRALADSNYREARETIRAMLAEYDEPAFARIPRIGELRRAQLEKAARFYDRVLASSRSTRPEVMVDTARAEIEAGTLQYLLGRHGDAVRLAERALGLIDAAERAEPSLMDYDAERADVRIKLGLFLAKSPDGRERAVAELRRAAGEAERAVARNPGSPKARSTVALAYHDLGSVLIDLRRWEQSLSAHRRAIEINRRLVAEAPGDARRSGILAENLSNLGLLTSQSNPEEAESAYQEAARLLEELHRSDPSIRWVVALASALNNWAGFDANRKPQAAFERLARGLTLVEEPLRHEPRDTMLRGVALNLHGTRGNLLARLGRHGESVADREKVVELNDQPADATLYRLQLILALVRSNRLDEGTAAVEKLGTELLRGKSGAGADFYNVACVYGVAAERVSADSSLSSDERAARSRAFADAAVRWLQSAAEKGYFENPKVREHAATDSDLAPLRLRADFQRLLEAPGTDPMKDRGVESEAPR